VSDGCGSTIVCGGGVAIRWPQDDALCGDGVHAKAYECGGLGLEPCWFPLTPPPGWDCIQPDGGASLSICCR
jgi:hypothetical protein